jgi:antitoxin VapB
MRKTTPLNIKDPEVYRLARELAERTGESMTEAVRKSLRERLAREESRRPDPALLAKLTEISDRCAARRVLDPRSAEEIIGYDDHGLPT